MLKVLSFKQVRFTPARTFIMTFNRNKVSKVSAGMLTGSAGPSTTTSILLTSLPESVNKKMLEELTNSMRVRKVDVQPGCSLHFSQPFEAANAAEVLGKNHKFQTSVRRATIPCVLAKNVDSKLSMEPTTTASNRSNIVVTTIEGSSHVSIKCGSSEHCLAVVEAIRLSGENNIKLTAEETSDGAYILKLFESPVGVESNALKEKLSSKLSKPILDSLTITDVPAANRSLVLRLHSSLENGPIDKFLSKNLLDKVTVIGAGKLNKPALYLRNIDHLNEAKVTQLLKPFKTERIQFLRSSDYSPLELAIAYFSSEQNAMEALANLKDNMLDNKRLLVAYREISEPAVSVGNLPEDINVEELRDICKDLQLTSAVITKSNGTEPSQAVLVFSTEREANLGISLLQGKKLRDHELTVQSLPLGDFGFEVVPADAATEAELLKLADDNGKFKSVTSSSNVSHAFGYKTLLEAREALSAFNANLPKGASPGLLSTLPIFTVEVEGLSPDTSAAEFLSGLPIAKPIKVDRNALLRLPKHSDVVPTMKNLKKLDVNGQKLRVQRYRPLVTEYNSSFDGESSSKVDYQEFDKFSLRSLLNDDLSNDPATRYQLAKNHFERHLNDAAGMVNIQTLLDNALPANLVEEARKLLIQFSKVRDNSDKAEAERISQRLFEIYLQREDMRRFSKDFRELQAALGSANESDVFNWSQFNVDEDERLLEAHRLGEEAARRNAAAMVGEKKNAKAKVVSSPAVVLETSDDDKSVQSDGAKDDNEDEDEDEDQSEDDGDDSEADTDAEKNKEDTLNPVLLQDSEGRVWSGVVLDTDMVQKTMPGNRIASHRALIAIGNLQGTGGFGMGKGKTSADAINAAFRAALRNLIHIDLYDNFGFAHDLHGKHNSCHAYIRATPSSRVMVASPFAQEVLLRLGVSSASVKLVGRRNPYSMVRAIFNAVSHHRNIDETAKARGKRYLTLKWLHDHGL